MAAVTTGWRKRHNNEIRGRDDMKEDGMVRNVESLVGYKNAYSF
jgi:hypothetical protein